MIIIELCWKQKKIRIITISWKKILEKNKLKKIDFIIAMNMDNFKKSFKSRDKGFYTKNSFLNNSKSMKRVA